jgi:hypothetical protein
MSSSRKEQTAAAAQTPAPAVDSQTPATAQAAETPATETPVVPVTFGDVEEVNDFKGLRSKRGGNRKMNADSQQFYNKMIAQKDRLTGETKVLNVLVSFNGDPKKAQTAARNAKTSFKRNFPNYNVRIVNTTGKIGITISLVEPAAPAAADVPAATA